MKKLEKEHLPKVIAVGALAAGLLGYAGYAWLGHGSGDPTPPAAAATAHPLASTPVPKAPSAVDKVLALPPIDHENPFIPTITADSGPAPHPPQPAAAKPASKPHGATMIASLPDTLKGPAMDSLPGLPPVLAGPAPSPAPAPAAKPAASPSPHAAAHAAAKPAPPKPPAVLVTGILAGQENVAILKWSDTQRQVVRVGDHLDGGYVVKSIRPDAVILALGNSQWVMRLGTASKA
jgi:hypothetical protein